VKSSDISVIVEGQQVTGWISGNVESSIITPADHFVLRLPGTEFSWRTLRRGAAIKINADRTTLLSGFIGRRHFAGKAGVLEISGRDRVGRLVDESAPKINYNDLGTLEAVRRLAAPWFATVTLSNARNRRLRVGKGRRVAAATEPVVTINVRAPRRGTVHPGQSRWQLIHEILSRAGLVGWSSADGTELFIGMPNQAQEAQHIFALGAPGGDVDTTVDDLEITEDDEDRFSLIQVVGAGGSTDANYGDSTTDHRGVVYDNTFNHIDGTGRDFIHPKRLIMPERAFDSNADAQRVAQNEKARRDYKRHIVSAHMAGFGQSLDGDDELSLFQPDTVGRVIVEELNIDDRYLAVACSYSFARDEADTTTVHLVPTGTEIVL
jgi:prophage tail gpP-like protein